MDPTLMMQLFSALGIGGGGGGGVGQPAMPPTGVPYSSETMALPQSTQAAPQDVTPMPVEPPPGPKLQMPTMDSLKRAIGLGGGGPSPMMSPTGGVPYGNPSQSLGEALQPQPAPGVPMPMSRPPELGLGTAGGTGPGSPGNYGGSPETNPNLKPVGSPAAKTPPMDLTKLLSGIKPPARPDVMKPSTPAAPQSKAPGASELLQLLSALGMGGSRGMRMPTTLGQALELKPSAWGGVYG